MQITHIPENEALVMARRILMAHEQRGRVSLRVNQEIDKDGRTLFKYDVLNTGWTAPIQDSPFS